MKTFEEELQRQHTLYYIVIMVVYSQPLDYIPLIGYVMHSHEQILKLQSIFVDLYPNFPSLTFVSATHDAF